jgi:hypothetical protein
VAYKVFTNGSTLQASELNENLMQQSIATFSNAAARTAAITSPVEGQMTYLLDVDRYDSWSGAAWLPVVAPGAWVSYTPTLTNMTLGNGTVTAAYAQIGKTIHVRFRFVLGSTSSIAASGQKSISLPFAARASIYSQFDVVGTASANISGTSPLAPLHLTPTLVLIAAQGTAGTWINTVDITNTIPATWTTNNTLTMNLTYEAA